MAERGAVAQDTGRKAGFVLVTDVGSTTTKALLLSRDEKGLLRFAGGVNVPTTVEKPHEDVRKGVSNALRKLESITGENLSRGQGMPSVPYLSTSSAGGGLQMLVFGLTSVETGRIVENTASNAGGVVLRTISIDDELQAVEKMQLIQSLHPDMIMLAGGTDGGAIAGVVRLAELLSLSEPQPKFRQNMKIPLIFCGNKDARPFVREVLEDTFEVHIVDNIRPSMSEMNMDPARREVHRLFMENVMERAPGYSELKRHTVSDILPTPAGVEKILRLYSGHSGEQTVLVDIGGATTDIFSCITGEYSRTVAANTGMSYSMANILHDSGIGSVMDNLPESFGEDDVRDYLYNKTITPTYVPSGPGEVLAEQAAAIAGMRSAWRDHLETCFRLVRVGFLDRLKGLNRKMFEETFRTREDTAFQLSGIDMITGAGGVLSHADSGMAFWMLTEGFRPHGVTCLAVDRGFRTPHLGVLSEIDEESALRLFLDECLEKLGWVVAPVGGFEEGDTVMKVRDPGSGETAELSFGDAVLLENGGDLEFLPQGSASLGGHDGRLKTELPVLLDCRGRGEGASRRTLRPLFMSGEVGSMETSIEPPRGRLEKGEWEKEYRLPYSGTILVEEGDRVEPGTVLGENRYDPPRLYIIDLNKIPGYDRHLTPEEVREGLLVGVGDRIKLNSALYKVHRPGITGFDFTFRSPVRGEVTRIEKNGLIIVREIQDYDDRPHVVEIAGPLGVKPKHIGAYLRKNLDDFVEAGQVIASDMSAGKVVSVKSPTTGVIRAVDRKKGTVTVRYDMDPVRMVSHVTGTVAESVPDRMVLVRGEGTCLYGVIGFGGESSGPLMEAEDPDSCRLEGNSIVFTASAVSCAFLRKAAEAGVSGIIAPSIPASQWREYSGRELGVAVTGDEDIPFTFVLTAGFGGFSMRGECLEFLRGSVGRSACLSGRTQIRAGVTRPMVIV